MASSMNLSTNLQSSNVNYTAAGGGMLNVHNGPTVNVPPAVPVKPQLRRCPAPSRNYVARPSIEACMSNYFFETEHKAHCLVLRGLGGSGKSDLARNFADMHFYSLLPHSPRFSGVYYVDATTTATMTESLQNIALAAGVGNTWSDAIRYLENALPPVSNWLVVYDNADDPKIDLNEYLPTCTHGNIIITTRNYEARLYGVGPRSDIEVSDMTSSEALKLLLAQAGLEETAEETELVAAKQLIQELNCFALAVNQAGAYMRAQSCSIPRYTTLFRQRRDSLYQQHGSRVQSADMYRHRSTHATWLISYEQLSPSSSLLLKIWSFFHHEGIKEIFFEEACSRIGEYSDPTIPLSEEQQAALAIAKDFLSDLSSDGEWDSLRFSALVRELRLFSLIRYDESQDAYSIHPLVHHWTHQLSLPSTYIQLCTSILLGACIPMGKTYNEYMYRRLVLLHLDSILSSLAISSIDLHSLWSYSAVYNDAGKYEQHLTLLSHILEDIRRVLGEEHPNTLASMSNLAQTYWKQGQYAKAESLVVKVLEVQKRVLGEEHPHTLLSMDSLALIYLDQDHYAKAELLQVKTLEILRRVLGEEHPDTIQSMNNLAACYWKQGHYAKAESLQVKALESWRRVLGEEHPDTLTSMNGLAAIYGEQGHHAKAEPLHLEVLEVHKRVLEEEHPDTLKSMYNLASIYHMQQQHADAELLAEKCFELCTRVLGTEHFLTQVSLRRLRKIQAAIQAGSHANHPQPEVVSVSQVELDKGRKGFKGRFRDARRKVMAKLQR